jgi:hypothetical protein
VACSAPIIPALLVELHNQMILADGGDPNGALDELKNVGYGTFSFDGSPMDTSVILKEPIVRVMARRVDHPLVGFAAPVVDPPDARVSPAVEGGLLRRTKTESRYPR